MEISEKLAVLARVAHRLNGEDITWAVGASLLLYFKGIVADFHDIDLSVAEADVPAVRAALDGMGAVQARQPDERYKTRTFLEYAIDGVELDIMAGFAIVADGVEHYLPLRKADIAEHIQLAGEVIPLHSLAQWRTYYSLMGREAKVRLIDGHGQSRR